MKSCFYKVLSLSCAIALLGGSVSAKDYSYGNYEESKGYDNYGLGNNESYTSEKETQEADYYPFTKSQGRVDNKDVVGIRIFGDKIVLLAENNTYFEEQGQKQNFSEFDFFSKYPRLLSVEIINTNLTKEMLENLQKFLPNTIKSLIVNSCTIANADFEGFTSIITGHKQLESLTVINPDMAQAESAKLVAAVGDLKVIRYMRLTLGEIGAGGCDVLKEALLKSKNTLLGLNLGFIEVDDNESSDKLLASMGKLKNLEKLEYSVRRSTAKQVGTFFSSLAGLTKLTDLKINFRDFSSHDGVETYHNAESLNEAMKNLKNLESLDISDMNLPDSVLQTISRSLGELSKLKTLNISKNPINAKTAKVLSESLKNMDSLYALIANYCEINDEAFSALCGNLQNSPLQYMCFSGNNIVNSVKSLPISQMQSLIALDFTHNKIKLSDVIEFMKSIPKGSKLEVVNWEGNDFRKISEEERTKKINNLKIWKSDHKINTLDLGI